MNSIYKNIAEVVVCLGEELALHAGLLMSLVGDPAEEISQHFVIKGKERFDTIKVKPRLFFKDLPSHPDRK